MQPKTLSRSRASAHFDVLTLMAVLLAASLSAGQRAAGQTPASESPIESVALLENGGFEDVLPDTQDVPAGWHAPDTARPWRQDRDKKLAGTGALRVEPGPEAFTVHSAPIEIDAGLQSVSGLVMVLGAPEAQARLRWWSSLAYLQSSAAGANPLREDSYNPVGSGDGWRRLALSQQVPPEGAEVLEVVLVSPPSEQPIYWDQAQLTGQVARVPEIQVFVNRVGYETAMPKAFTVSTNFLATEALFRVKDVLETEVFAGELRGGVEVKSETRPAWGGYYWRGDFSNFDAPGSYMIEVELDGQIGQSSFFELETDLLWNATFDLVWNSFRLHRCGDPSHPLHGACHLDDHSGGKPVAGGWHDGSHYGKENNPYFLWKLAEVHNIIGWRLRARNDAEAPEPLHRELAWGAALLESTLQEDGTARALPAPNAFWGLPEAETDNLPDTGDERALGPLPLGLSGLHGNALSRAALDLPDPAPAVAAVRRALRAMQGIPAHASLQFATLFNLWRLDPEEQPVDTVHAALPPQPNLDVLEEFFQYEGNFATGIYMDLVIQAQAEAEAILARVDNPFGVYPYPITEGGAFFKPVAAVDGVREGNTAHILEAAEKVAKAYRLVAKREYLEFVYDQLNWILGVNPFGICLLAGVTDDQMPSYYHPYVLAGVARGAVPGVIANGIAARGPGDDRPYLDLSGSEKPEPGTNGVTLKNSALYLGALGHIKRIPMGSPFGEQPRPAARPAAEETVDAP